MPQHARFLLLIAVVCAVCTLSIAARAEWYIAKVGGETCVPLEELGSDGKYHSVGMGVIHTPEDYIHVLGGPHLNLAPEPNTPVGMIKYKLGNDAYIMFFNDRGVCQSAWAGVRH
jgi:hypothetical protein